MKEKNHTYNVLGIMSGTSLDGVDFALCKFIKKTKWSFKITKCITYQYDKKWKEILKNLHQQNKRTIEKINIKYGDYLGDLVISFLQKEKIDIICCHGHTIFHDPKNNYTLQIGDGKTIANKTKTTTVNNFRNLDISLNGQGAPLVPIGDLHLFNDYQYCVNLGGFANISIKKNKTINAFDICPVNIVLNELSEKLGKDYDEKGKFARDGKIISKLLKDLNKINFYKYEPPKSLSREWTEQYIFPLFIQEYATKDILHTVCEHVAIQISRYLKDNEALFTGGGVYNSYLMERILFYSKSKIIIPSKEIIEYKEALIFGFLGILKLRSEVNCLKDVTGADYDNCGGEIHFYKK